MEHMMLNIVAEPSPAEVRIIHADGRVETKLVGPGEVVEIPRGARVVPVALPTTVDLGWID